MAGKKKHQQSKAPQRAAPEQTAAAQQQSAPPPEPEEEPVQDQAPSESPEQTGAPDDTAPPQDAGEPADSTAAGETGGGMAGPDETSVGNGKGPGEDEETAESEEERRRVAEMTRTVQLSLEQIMAAMADADAAAGDVQGPEEASDMGEDPGVAPADEAKPEENLPPVRMPRPEPSLGRRIGRAAGIGVLTITRWLLLVLFFVALIAACGIAFLYRGATRDLIPQVSVTLDGQTVQPTAYDWNVPVVNHMFSRNYHGTYSEQAQTLTEAVEGIRPELVVTPQDFETNLVLKDSDGSELFNGTVFEYSEFSFDKDGVYTAELTVSNHANRFDVNTVEGSQTYEFAFNITLHPAVRLNASAALQGDVVAVVASGIALNDEPQLLCGLENVGFVPAQNGWIAYVPIPMDAEPGEYLFTVKSSKHEQTLHLTVHERAWRSLPLLLEDSLHWAWIGEENTPEAVKEVLKTNEKKIYWRDEGFAMPYEGDMEIELEYGTEENVNNGMGTVRRSINMVAAVPNSAYGTALKAPAAGKVVFAEDLGGERSPEHGIMLPNKTLVIDHGGGLKTVYYNLRSIDVSVGDIVEQGQDVGTCQLTLCIGAYAGEVPIDPMTLWKGQSGAVKYY